MNSRNRNAKIKAMLAMALVLPSLVAAASPARCRVQRGERAEGRVAVDMTLEMPLPGSFLIPGGQAVRLDAWQVEQTTKVFQFPVQEGELEVTVEPENLVDAAVVTADGVATVTLTHKVHLHSYTETVVPPTCEAEGYTGHICICGDSYQDNKVEPLGHTPVADPAVGPTCTETGLTEGLHCSVCGEVLVAQQTAPALGHVFGEGKVTAPGCETKGYTTFTCTVCGDSEVRDETDALGHNYETTETETGDKISTCTRCRHTYTESQTPPETTDPTDPEETEPTDPETTDPTDPEETEPTDPEETEPTPDPAPADPEPVDTETTDPTTDPTTVPGEPESDPLVLLTEPTVVTIRISCGEAFAIFRTELLPAVTQENSGESGDSTDENTGNMPEDGTQSPTEGGTAEPLTEGTEAVLDFTDDLGAVVQDHLYWLSLTPQEGVTYTLRIKGGDGKLLPNVRYSLDGGLTYTVMLEPEILSLPGETRQVLLDFRYTDLFEVPEGSGAADSEITDPATTEPSVTEPAATEPGTGEPGATEQEKTEPEPKRVTIIVEGSNGCSTALYPEVQLWVAPESIVLTDIQSVGIMDPTAGSNTICVIHKLEQAEDGTISWQEVLRKNCAEQETDQDLFYLEYVDSDWLQLQVTPGHTPLAGSYRLTVYHQVGEALLLWDEVPFFIQYPMIGAYTGGQE